jgi:hypothetical protein
MPRMDGLELVSAIKQQKPETECVIVSAYSDFEVARKVLGYRIAGYILKPLEKTTFWICSIPSNPGLIIRSENLFLSTWRTKNPWVNCRLISAILPGAVITVLFCPWFR